MLEPGLTHTSEQTVTPELTARHMGSGDLEVLATPAMTALMENAAMLAVADSLPEGSTTVGGHIETSHLRPTRPGQKFKARATLQSIEGRKLLFHVEAFEGEHLIGEGTHLRFIVDREKFMSRL
jgi:fluoroacetyl-CoA thioesterase